MRLLILITVIIKTFYFFEYQNNDAFLNKVTNNFSRNSYYLNLEIINKKKLMSVVIKNDDLFSYFQMQRNFNKEEYKIYIKSIINDNKSVNINTNDISKYGFVIVEPNKEIDSESKKGEAMILNKYFNSRVLIKSITSSNKFSIIKALFKLRIATRIDDESGFLIYEK